MSRLIDADKIVSLLEVARQPYNAPILNGVIKTIHAMPTAYDVDKVVRELEEESMCGGYDLTECKGDYTNRCLRCVDCVVVSKEAIDIVKRGGVECEK